MGLNREIRSISVLQQASEKTYSDIEAFMLLISSVMSVEISWLRFFSSENSI